MGSAKNTCYHLGFRQNLKYFLMCYSQLSAALVIGFADQVTALFILTLLYSLSCAEILKGFLYHVI